MKPDDIPVEEEPFTLLAGTPTITFQLEEGHEMMLPYHSFKQGFFREHHISLIFADGNVMIAGKHMRELWEHLQIQDVRFIKPKKADTKGEIVLTSVVWVPDETE